MDLINHLSPMRKVSGETLMLLYPVLVLVPEQLYNPVEAYDLAMTLSKKQALPKATDRMEIDGVLHLSTKAAALHCGVSENTLLRKKRRGELPSANVRQPGCGGSATAFFPVPSLDAWLRERVIEVAR